MEPSTVILDGLLAVVTRVRGEMSFVISAPFPTGDLII